MIHLFKLTFYTDSQDITIDHFVFVVIYICNRHFLLYERADLTTSQAVSQLIKWQIFNKNIPFYGNIGVKLTCFALDSSVLWPFYPVLKPDHELRHSLICFVAADSR